MGISSDSRNKVESVTSRLQHFTELYTGVAVIVSQYVKKKQLAKPPLFIF